MFHPIHSISGSQLSLAPSSVIHMGVIITALFGYKLFLPETGYPDLLSRLWSFLFSSLPEREAPSLLLKRMKQILVMTFYIISTGLTGSTHKMHPTQNKLFLEVTLFPYN